MAVRWPRVTEKRFLADVIRAARLFGWYAYHVHDSKRSEPGFPDLVCVHPRHGCFVAELKVGRNRLTPAQRDWLTAFRMADVPAYEWRPENWEAIERVLRGE